MDSNKSSGRPKQKIKSNRNILLMIIGVVILFILIVGILGTIALKSLFSARDKARRASALSKATEMVNPVNICIEGGGEIKKIKEESYVCSDMSLLEEENINPEKWSVLPEGHSYGKFNFSEDGEWNFSINHDEDGEVIICRRDGCSEVDD